MELMLTKNNFSCKYLKLIIEIYYIALHHQPWDFKNSKIAYILATPKLLQCHLNMFFAVTPPINGMLVIFSRYLFWPSKLKKQINSFFCTSFTEVLCFIFEQVFTYKSVVCLYQNRCCLNQSVNDKKKQWLKNQKSKK